MCLAVPGEVLAIQDEDTPFPLGKIKFGGITKEASLALLPEAKVGDYVLVHAGVALNVVNEEEAAEIFACLEELDQLEELEEPAP